MKKGFLCSLLFLLFFSLSAQHSDGSSSGYKITGEITGLGNDTVLLAYYFGGKQYASDTAYCTNGKFIFKGKKSLQGGMYLVVLPGNKYFDIIVSEQQFGIKTDINSLVPSMRFKNSKENTLFYEYLNFITNRDKTTATNTSAIGGTLGQTKFQIHTNTNHPNHKKSKSLIFIL